MNTDVLFTVAGFCSSCLKINSVQHIYRSIDISFNDLFTLNKCVCVIFMYDAISTEHRTSPLSFPVFWGRGYSWEGDGGWGGGDLSPLWSMWLSGGSCHRLPALLHLVGLSQCLQLGKQLGECLLHAFLQQPSLALTLWVLRVQHSLQCRAQVLQPRHVHRLTRTQEHTELEYVHHSSTHFCGQFLFPVWMRRLQLYSTVIIQTSTLVISQSECYQKPGGEVTDKVSGVSEQRQHQWCSTNSDWVQDVVFKSIACCHASGQSCCFDPDTEFFSPSSWPSQNATCCRCGQINPPRIVPDPRWAWPPFGSLTNHNLSTRSMTEPWTSAAVETSECCKNNEHLVRSTQTPGEVTQVNSYREQLMMSSKSSSIRTKNWLNESDFILNFSVNFICKKKMLKHETAFWCKQTEELKLRTNISPSPLAVMLITL